jgi:hypothetical protein
MKSTKIRKNPKILSPEAKFMLFILLFSTNVGRRQAKENFMRLISIPDYFGG